MEFPQEKRVKTCSKKVYSPAMKTHVIIACLLGVLAIGYIIAAPQEAPLPDSIESIAQDQQHVPGTSAQLRFDRGFLAIV